MSATFIEKIRAWIQRPMMEKEPGDELLGCLVIAGVLGLIWLIGEIIYRWEGRR